MAQSVIAVTHIGLFYHGSYAENTNLHRYVHTMLKDVGMLSVLVCVGITQHQLVYRWCSLTKANGAVATYTVV